jgi:hypothetical protein
MGSVMSVFNLRRTRWFALLPILFACTTEPQIEPKAKAPEPKAPEPKAPEPKAPEVTTANPTLDPPPTPPEPKLPAQDGFFMAEGAPPPRGCTSAGDCHGDTIPDVDNPCCQDPHTLEAHALAYRDWVNAWRKDRCASVTCPPPPNPSQPPACAFDVDCVQGQCVDACK